MRRWNIICDLRVSVVLRQIYAFGMLEQFAIEWSGFFVGECK